MKKWRKEDKGKEMRINDNKIIYLNLKKDTIKINTIENIIIFFNYITVCIIKFLIIINYFNQTESNIILFKNTKISLKIKGVGESIILDVDFDKKYYPNEVYINGNKQNKISNTYFFNQTDNFVELIWDDKLINCEYMFYRCYKITEIDLSNFNTSNITSMLGIFYECSSLTSINLSNFDTSKVIDMYAMFYGCSSLISVDLTNFDTSQVTDMNGMFEECSSLTSLDLTNFDTSQVTDMNSMFYGCKSLTSLDLSIFNTSKVTDMENMFGFCPLLTSLDLYILILHRFRL